MPEDLINFLSLGSNDQEWLTTSQNEQLAHLCTRDTCF